MQIRRAVAAVLTAVALVGGGATLTACSDPAGLDRRDGVPDDHVSNTRGNDPSSDQQGNLPDTSDNKGETSVQEDTGNQQG